MIHNDKEQTHSLDQCPDKCNGKGACMSYTDDPMGQPRCWCYLGFSVSLRFIFMKCSYYNFAFMFEVSVLIVNSFSRVRRVSSKTTHAQINAAAVDNALSPSVIVMNPSGE